MIRRYIAWRNCNAHDRALRDSADLGNICSISEGDARDGRPAGSPGCCVSIGERHVAGPIFVEAENHEDLVQARESLGSGGIIRGFQTGWATTQPLPGVGVSRPRHTIRGCETSCPW
jgi:hypothetical protein